MKCFCTIFRPTASKINRPLALVWQKEPIVDLDFSACFVPVLYEGLFFFLRIVAVLIENSKCLL